MANTVSHRGSGLHAPDGVTEREREPDDVAGQEHALRKRRRQHAEERRIQDFGCQIGDWEGQRLEVRTRRRGRIAQPMEQVHGRAHVDRPIHRADGLRIQSGSRFASVPRTRTIAGRFRAADATFSDERCAPRRAMPKVPIGAGSISLGRTSFRMAIVPRCDTGRAVSPPHVSSAGGGSFVLVPAHTMSETLACTMPRLLGDRIGPSALGRRRGTRTWGGLIAR